MKATASGNDDLQKELAELRAQLQEANELIHAIRTGQVDALVIENGKGHQLYTLKTADQTYRVFIEKMKEGAVTLDTHGIILYSNSQFAAMVDMPLTNVIGLDFSSFITEDEKEIYRLAVHTGWQSDVKGEFMLQSSTGRTTPVLLSFTSLQMDEGVSLSIILTDLTILKEAEHKLKVQNELLEEARRKTSLMNEALEDIVRERTRDLTLSREHFKFLADNIPVIVWTARPDGTIDYLSNLWTKYCGLTLEQSTDGLQTVVHPDDKAANTAAWKEAIANNTRFEFEHRLKRHRDGQYRWHLGYAVPFKDGLGNTIAWVGTFTDIEDQKREMQKKDEFISVASHELKTPLTSVKAYIQLIGRKDGLSPEITQYVEKANESVGKLQHLISDLLDVSKIQAGKLKFHISRVPLKALIQSCVENIRHIYPSHKIKLELGDELMVMGNAERLEQVIMNLVSNAVKYSPDHQEIVLLLVREQNMAVVSVVDFGIGLSETNQQKIFERFYRVENGNGNQPTPGLGMGLYISSEIIKEHGGRLEVKSKLKEGSVFSFYLPLTTTA